jgi:hypothetical protein
LEAVPQTRRERVGSRSVTVETYRIDLKLERRPIAGINGSVLHEPEDSCDDDVGIMNHGARAISWRQRAVRFVRPIRKPLGSHREAFGLSRSEQARTG